MNFIYPSFLWALFALAIPILIHIFHFRKYKTVYFSNVNFLKEVKQERNNIRKLKRWLLLLSRLLALLFLIAAFAQPFLKSKNKVVSGSTAVSIYLDNSFSMGLKSKDIELLDWGKERAAEIVNSYSERDEFLVLSNEMQIEEQRWKSKEDALSSINNIQISSKSVPLETIVKKQKYLFSRSNSSHLKNYIISDFQRSAIKDFELEKDSSQSNYFIHLQADDIKNIYIDSVWMIDPISIIGRGSSVLYKIKNSSELDARDIQVTLKINNEVQTVRQLNLIAEEERIDTAYFNVLKEGWQLAEIGITDYPITIDDVFYFSFEVKKTRKVLEIYEGNTNNIIESVFSKDDYIEFVRKKSDQLDYSTFQDYDLIILNELKSISSGLVSSTSQYVEGGGRTLLIPSAIAQESVYKDLMMEVAGIYFGSVKYGNYNLVKPNLSLKLLQGIVSDYPSNADMPIIKKYFQINAGSKTLEQNILMLNNNASLLSVYPKGSGNLFIQSVANDNQFSELQSHWSYAPIIYNIALSQGLDKQLYHIKGENEWIAINSKLHRKENMVSISGENIDFIPEQRMVNNRLFINADKNEQISFGQYKATLNDKLLANLSFNLNRLESEMKFTGIEELAKQFPSVASISSGLKGPLTQNIKLNNEGRPLWRICIMLALLSLIIEVAIIKLIPD